MTKKGDRGNSKAEVPSKILKHHGGGGKETHQGKAAKKKKPQRQTTGSCNWKTAPKEIGTESNKLNQQGRAERKKAIVGK